MVDSPYINWYRISSTNSTFSADVDSSYAKRPATTGETSVPHLCVSIKLHSTTATGKGTSSRHTNVPWKISSKQRP